ncbi:MAG TPA: hypothetical protein PL000_17430, partial [Anaerolineales bacterium]|nr:hypothetical protein [Anaerolineales bacterium]
PAGADGADAVVHEGTAEIDFGSTPTDSGSVSITGQTGILTTSRPRAWFVSRATTDNSAADHEQAAARCVVICSEPIADTGFTISVFCQGYVTGKFSIEWSWI